MSRTMVRPDRTRKGMKICYLTYVIVKLAGKK